MKRAIFFVMAVIAGFATQTATAQYSYGYNYGAPQQQGYYASGGGYAPTYYYGSQDTGQARYSQGDPYRDYIYNPEMERFKQAHTKSDYGKNPPVEIWLERRIGRIGDYWFPALGGSSKHPTPTGTFTVKSKYKDFYSRKYKAEMPLSVFFTEQCALHVGSLKVKSHGCIHLDRAAAQAVFDHTKPGGSVKVIVHP